MNGEITLRYARCSFLIPKMYNALLGYAALVDHNARIRWLVSSPIPPMLIILGTCGALRHRDRKDAGMHPNTPPRFAQQKQLTLLCLTSFIQSIYERIHTRMKQPLLVL